MARECEPADATTRDFSLVLGGLLYQFLARVGLLTPPVGRLAWRLIAAGVIAWLPPLLLTMLDGRLLGGVRVPFLHDFEVQCRLLLNIPLLIFAEVTVHSRMRGLVQEFRKRQIVPDASAEEFDSLIDSALRLRNSKALELCLLVAIVLAGGFLWREMAALQADTWSATVGAGGRVNTPAGNWYQFVSVPLSQFLVLRWYFRILIWWRFLWQVSNLKLNLIPTHPDGACGLTFLDAIIPAMAPFQLAHSCLISGYLLNRILYEGAKPADFSVEMAGLATFLILVTLGPFCVFTVDLLEARISGLRIYGRLASDYVAAFHRKWVAGVRPPGEQLVGSGDIQSLADLANSYSVVRSIVPVPVERGSIIGLLAIIALPLLPLSLTMFSLRELVVRLLQVVL